jgi:hypothetical protein
MFRTRSFLRTSLFLASVLAATPAAADMFHLAKEGLCNRTSVPQDFVMIFEDTCTGSKISERKHFDDDHGGTLAPGECASASFEVNSPGPAFNCQSDVKFEIGAGGICAFHLHPGTELEPKSIRIDDHYDCGGTLHATHGDEHFQVEIR